MPSPTLNYLTLWPDGEGQPVVSTLNAVDGSITSNMAIVPNQNGKIDAYARGMTQLILTTSPAKDGSITSNMAIVPNQNGKIDAYARGMTQLILDISSYFAP